MTPHAQLCIKPATAADVPIILDMARALAAYEKMPNAVTANEADVRMALFGPQPRAEAVIGIVNGEPAGMAVFFHTFSTFLGRPGLYLEDIFVEERCRGQGLGRALLVHVAEIAVRRGCARLEWSVLNWNAPAIGFYRSLGAKPMNEWTVYRLSGEALQELARQA